MRQKPKVLTCKKPISQQLCDLYNLYLITIYLKKYLQGESHNNSRWFVFFTCTW